MVEDCKEEEHRNTMPSESQMQNSANKLSRESLADFVPLIVMVAVVMILTFLGARFLEQDLMLAFMGYFFLIFGALKVMRLSSFVEAYRMYDVLAKRSKTYAYAYPFLELGFAVSYLFAWQVKVVSFVVLVVMLIGSYGVYRKLRQKETIPCACMGTVFKIPMTWVTLGEDVTMAVMALFILLS